MTALPEPSACPAWCAGDHGGGGDGWDEIQRVTEGVALIKPHYGKHVVVADGSDEMTVYLQRHDDWYSGDVEVQEELRICISGCDSFTIADARRIRDEIDCLIRQAEAETTCP